MISTQPPRRSRPPAPFPARSVGSNLRAPVRAPDGTVLLPPPPARGDRPAPWPLVAAPVLNAAPMSAEERCADPARAIVSLYRKHCTAESFDRMEQFKVVRQVASGDSDLANITVLGSVAGFPEITLWCGPERCVRMGTEGLRAALHDALPHLAHMPAFHKVALDVSEAYGAVEHDRSQRNRRHNAQLLCRFVCLCRAAGVTPGRMEAAAPLVHEVLSLRDPRMRRVLLPAMVVNLLSPAADDGVFERFLAAREQPRNCTLLDALLLVGGQMAALDHKAVTDFLHRGPLRRNGESLARVMDALWRIMGTPALSRPEKTQLIVHNLQSLCFVAGAIAVGQARALMEPTHHTEVWRTLLHCEDVPDFPQHLRQFFGTLREPDLLGLYIAKLHELPGEEGERTRTHLHRVLPALVQGQLQQLRATDANAATDGAADAALMTRWMDGARAPVEALGMPLQRKGHSWLACDSADAAHFLESGDDVQNSCMSLLRDAMHNRCLVGRLCDPTKRMLLLQDVDGRIGARAMWRLLRDETGRRVAVLDKMYGSNRLTPQQAADALLRLAAVRGEALGVDVYASMDWLQEGRELRRSALMVQSAESAVADYWDDQGAQCRQPLTYLPSALLVVWQLPSAEPPTRASGWEWQEP